MSTISTISTLQKSLSSRQTIANQDREVSKARDELVSGLKSDVYADRSFRAAQTLDLRNRMARAESFATSNRLLAGKMSVTADVISDMRGSVQEFRALTTSLSAGTQRRDVLQGQAEALLKTVTAQLNTVYGGEFLFSGSASGSLSLSLPAGGFTVAGLASDAGLSEAEAQMRLVDGYFGLNGAGVTDPSYLSEAYKGSLQPASARLDESISADYGMNAGEEAVRQMLKGLAMFAATDVDTLEDPAAYQAWTAAANDALNSAVILLQSQEVALGNQQKLLSQTIERQDTLTGIYNNRVMDIEGVDEYEVATRLEALSAQLEASYAVTVRLKSLSLLNFL